MRARRTGRVGQCWTDLEGANIQMINELDGKTKWSRRREMDTMDIVTSYMRTCKRSLNDCT
jgi:hypothetical protein